jgi:serine/threonine protein kinase
MALRPGARLGPYEIVALIGAGGMGEVFRAHDTKLGRDVAIKILPELFTTDPERLARFDREARVLASLNHPNIAAIYGLEDAQEHRALVLELVEGETLAEKIQGLRAEGLGLEEALTIARQIVDALDAAHEKGVIHRDLKPANIKVTPGGVVKVLDFGLAKLQAGGAGEAGEAGGTGRVDPSMSPTLMTAATNAGVILGTAAYMSPEQARGRIVDKRSDIWAFGCVLYELLTGRRPFGAAEVSDMLALILTKEPDWTALPPATPTSIRRLLRRCLEKDRTKRLADISDARFDLQDTTADEPARSTSAAPPRARVAWTISAIAALAAAALAIPATRFMRQSPAEAVTTYLEITTPPTTDPISFALSPDGRSVAFVAMSEGLSRLSIRSLSQATAQPLVGTDGASYPFWAPDSRAIGFFADGKLKRIDKSGGAAITLADASGARGGTWNTDDVILFSPGTTSGLMRVAASGGTPTAVTQLAAGQGSHRWPQFLPDGRHFLFFVALTRPEQQGVYLASLDGGEPRFVVTTETAASFVAPDWLLTIRQGVLMAIRFDVARGTVSGEPVPVAQSVGFDGGLFRGAVAASPTVLAHRAGGAGRRQLQWFDRAGVRHGEIGALDDSVLSYPELALDDRHLSVRRTVQGNLDLWLWDIPRGAMSRFTSDYALDNMALWSPDAQIVVFSSIRKTGIYELFEKPVSGISEERAFLESPENKAAMSWSRDGRFVLYTSDNPKNRSDLWAVPMTGDRKPFPWLQTPFDETAGQFSPDGRWVSYQSNQSGRYEIFLRPFPGPGSQLQVSTGGGIWPRWRRDGKEIFYLSPDNRLMAVPVVSHAGSQMDAGVPVALFQPRLLAGGGINVGGFLSRAQYDVASDGRFLFNTNVDEATSLPINIVLNWAAALKRP